jgi:hypothetical protein
MPLETKCAKFIENLENQIGALIISNALNEMSTIIDSLDWITQIIVLILKEMTKFFIISYFTNFCNLDNTSKKKSIIG